MYSIYIYIYPIAIKGDNYIIHMHPYASVYSYASVTHPYAPIRLRYASERQCSTHVFASKAYTKKYVETAKFELRWVA